MRFSTLMTDAPNTRDEAGENERLSAGRQKAGGSCRHRLGSPPSARRHKGAGARQKSGLFFWTGQVAQPLAALPPYGCGNPLRVRPVFFSTRLKRKWGAESIAGHRQIPPAR